VDVHRVDEPAAANESERDPVSTWAAIDSVVGQFLPLMVTSFGVLPTKSIAG